MGQGGPRPRRFFDSFDYAQDSTKLKIVIHSEL
jgi:hypothetical protein